jgi:hypothetical protein
MKRIDFLLDHGAVGRMRDERRKELERRKRKYALEAARADNADEFDLWQRFIRETERELRELR